MTDAEKKAAAREKAQKPMSAKGSKKPSSNRSKTPGIMTEYRDLLFAAQFGTIPIAPMSSV